MPKYLPIPGTWAWRGDTRDARSEWWHPRSPFGLFLASHGIEHVCPDEPYVWTTSINGAVFWRKSHVDWQAAGASLSWYLTNPNTFGPAEVPISDRRLIAHSHGLQPILYAASFRGLEIDTLISIGSPVREDMAAVARSARPRIRRWLHLYSGWSDRLQWYGEWFDGRFGVARQHPMADQNMEIPGKCGHSRILKDPAAFGLWESERWMDWLTT